MPVLARIHYLDFHVLWHFCFDHLSSEWFTFCCIFFFFFFFWARRFDTMTLMKNWKWTYALLVFDLVLLRIWLQYFARRIQKWHWNCHKMLCCVNKLVCHLIYSICLHFISLYMNSLPLFGSTENSHPKFQSKSKTCTNWP